MVAAKNWRRFRCSWTNRKWPKLIPDCDNSAVNWNFTWNDVEVLGLSLFPFLKVSRYVDPASRIDITECHSRLRWLQNYDIPCSPLQSRSFTSIQMIHTHTRPEPGQPWKARGRKKRTQTTGKRPKQRRGGREQTDLQNQPTRRAPAQSTHLNHTTHYRGAGGKIRGQMGN